MISVVIITCNREHSIIKSIESCKKNIGMDWELIIVDNASKDNTEIKCKEYCQVNNIKLNYIKNDSNKGVAGARNQGFLNANGDVVYFLDDDAIIEDNYQCIDRAYKYLLSKNNVLILSSKIYDYSLNDYMLEFPEYKKIMDDGVNLRSFIGCSHFIKKNDLYKDFLYPENLMYGAEEFYLSMLVHSHDFRIEYYDDVFVRHYPSKNTRLEPLERRIICAINSIIVKKYLYSSFYYFQAYVLYLLRICKITKFNLKNMLSIRKDRKNKYVKKYEQKMKMGKLSEIVSKFGYGKIIK